MHFIKRNQRDEKRRSLEVKYMKKEYQLNWYAIILSVISITITFIFTRNQIDIMNRQTDIAEAQTTLLENQTIIQETDYQPIFSFFISNYKQLPSELLLSNDIRFSYDEADDDTIIFFPIDITNVGYRALNIDVQDLLILTLKWNEYTYYQTIPSFNYSLNGLFDIEIQERLVGSDVFQYGFQNNIDINKDNFSDSINDSIYVANMNATKKDISGIVDKIKQLYIDIIPPYKKDSFFDFVYPAYSVFESNYFYACTPQIIRSVQPLDENYTRNEYDFLDYSYTSIKLSRYIIIKYIDVFKNEHRLIYQVNSTPTKYPSLSTTLIFEQEKINSIFSAHVEKGYMKSIKKFLEDAINSDVHRYND